jgi:hypothetical protein
MRAAAVTICNPFDPHGSRDVKLLRKPMRVRALAPQTDAPVIAMLNGRPILRAEWRRRLRDGDRVDFHMLPLGGGGTAAGGSNPMQAVLSLALLSFAPWAAAGLLGTTTALVGTTFIGQLTTTAIALTGSALISALIPTQSSGALSTPQASPTYSLQAQGNTARLDQPIPVQYGRMQFSPDFAAQPYTEYVGADQFLYQLLCVGAGDFSIEQVLIDDTDISSFSEITTETVAPGGQVTLFPANVVTSAEVGGQEMVGMVICTYSQTGTTLTVTETNHSRASGQDVMLVFTSGTATNGVYSITGTPTANTWTATLPSATTSGGVNVQAIIGGANGFVANASGTVASRLAIDVILPRGLYGTSGSTLTDKTTTFTVQAQQIDDSGATIGGILTLGNETITDHTVTPIRKSFSYTLATAGRYAVRVYRTDVKDISSSSGDDLNWGALRAYLQEPTSYGQVTLLAMRMKATNNLTLQASRMVKVLATRKVPIWNGTSWSAATATRSIAWALADAARNTVYGAGLPDARIDLAGLLVLDATWAARGDSFDGRFDQSGTFWDAAVKIAAAGRAKPFLQGGILRLVRDDPNMVPVALFSMRNIIKGSFAIDFMLPTADMADSVQVSYFDSVSWASQRVTGTVPGGTTAKPAKIELFGVTDRAQALREATYLAASNKFRRQVVKFSTEMEGFIPSIGDMISVQHDMPGWGAQAEVVGWNATTQTLSLSEPMTFDGVSTYYVALRRVDGGQSGPWPVMPGPTAYDVILMTPPDITPQTGIEEERTHVAFGAGNTWAAQAKVLSVKPKGRYQVDIEAIVDDPSVYTAENGITAPPITYSSLPTTATKPVMQPFLARLDPANANQVLLSWQPAPGADTYNIEMAEGSDPTSTNATWTRVADTTGTQFALTLLAPFQTMIRIRGVGLVAGDWTAAALGSLLGRFWNLDPSTPIWTNPADPFWRPL